MNPLSIARYAAVAVVAAGVGVTGTLFTTNHTVPSSQKTIVKALATPSPIASPDLQDGHAGIAYQSQSSYSTSSPYHSPKGDFTIAFPSDWEVDHCDATAGFDDEHVFINPSFVPCMQAGLPAVMVQWQHGDVRTSRTQNMPVDASSLQSTTQVTVNGTPAIKDIYGVPAGTSGSSNNSTMYTFYKNGVTYFVLEIPQTIYDPGALDSIAQSFRFTG